MWLLYSIIGLTLLGLGDFIKKVMLKKGGDKEVFLFVCFVFYITIFGINYIFSGDKIINHTLIQSSFVIGTFDFLIPISMLTALKYLDTSLAFVSIRLISSFLILYVGVYILGDNLSFYNIIGFILGVIAIYFLSGFSFKQKHEIHKKGVIAVILAVIGIIGSQSYFKYIVTDIDIPSYMFFKFLVSFLLIILYMTIRKKFTNFNLIEIKKIFIFAILTNIIFVIYFLYILPNIYILGPLSLSYKMLSYSLIVPIGLSIIFFKEKVTKKRLIAFILTILSIVLFMF